MYKNKYHICTQQWLKVLKHLNLTIIISKKLEWDMVLRVISQIKNKRNKFQGQFTIVTKKIRSRIIAWRIIQKLSMVSTTNLINKSIPALKDKNNTFMDEKERVQEPIYLQILSICHWRKKHPNSLFLKMIEGYWQRNSRMSQVQEIMKTSLKVLR